MNLSKLTSMPTSNHFKFTADCVPDTDEERLAISKVPYSEIIGSVMYLMLCT